MIHPETSSSQTKHIEKKKLIKKKTLMTMSLAKQIEQLEYESSSSQAFQKIDIRLGRRTDWGFLFDLPEDYYYSLYSFFFYQNEWVERIFDTYHILDYRFGEEQVRINDDGFKFRNEYSLIKTGFIESHFVCDFQINVFSNNRFKNNTSKNMINFNLFSPEVTRQSVDEITLKYSDYFAIVFSKVVNLRNMSISYSVKLSINPFSRFQQASEPHTLLMLPNGNQIIKMLLEMDICLEVCGHPEGFHGMDNRLYTMIESKTAERLSSRDFCQESLKKYQEKQKEKNKNPEIIRFYTDFYAKPIC